MSKAASLDAAVERLHQVAIALGRIAPMRDPVADAAALDLSAAQVHVLLRLGHDGPLKMGVLASRVGVTLPACTRLVDRMKDDGLVLRERDPNDRRVVVVRLAAAGGRLFEQIQGSVREKLGALLGLLEADDREHLVTILEKLLQGLCDRLALDANSAASTTTSRTGHTP